ncbi:hypothetical protein [Methanoculleus sp.]|jgi:hypothetical protein|uniref:hypothetical protein n=1 Tax=Methanoculleus sp. TaxID=90427 RepID=UPI00261F999D|nr:hypothetical protein [Methanoculleus sp.]MDD2255426.1 hypothetical protein [Methanoculleus sp.]
MSGDQEIRISLDGNKWCALRGTNLQEGESGFGATPEIALMSLLAEHEWIETLTDDLQSIPATLRAARAVLKRTDYACGGRAGCRGCPAHLQPGCAVAEIEDALVAALAKMEGS